MYDPYRRIFQAEPVANDLPEWVPMGEDDQGQQFADSTGTFASLLKQRMGQGGPRSGMLGAKGSDAHLLHGGGSETKLPLLRSTDLGAGAGMMGAKSGGGMQSL